MTTPGFDDDPELRARLRSADPASSLPPAEAGRLARLLEGVMSEDLMTTESRTTGTHQRSPLTWAVAAAAAAVIVGVGLFAVLDRPGGEPKTPVAHDEATVTELVAPGMSAYLGRCMVPAAEPLSQATVAFDGVVTGIEGSEVTLEPTQWYVGEPSDTVIVQAPSEELQALISAVTFEEGGRYLVAANGRGQVMVCGFSAPYDEQLANLYDEAFAG